MRVDFYLDSSAKLDKSCTIGRFSVVGKGVKIGKNVVIGSNVVIHAGVEIGDNSIIGDGVILGQQPSLSKLSSLSYNKELPGLIIGRGVKIGSNAVVYAGSVLKDEVTVGDFASIREHCVVGPSSLIGRQVTLENQVKIGPATRIQTGAYITAYSEIGENVFIAPMVITTNDNYLGRTEERKEKIKGVTIRRGARIGAGVIILPGLEIAEESFIAAGSLVSRNTKPATVYMGIPAHPIRPVSPAELLSGEEIASDTLY